MARFARTLRRLTASAVLAAAAILTEGGGSVVEARAGVDPRGAVETAVDARLAVVADTLLPADTVPHVPDPLPAVRRPAPRPRLPIFPARVPTPEGRTAAAYECDRTCLLDLPWLTLGELVSEVAPGMLPVRGAWFGGPHYVVQGLGGAGAVRAVLDGRELVPLEAAQADLLRIPLVQLDHVRIIRRADGVRVEATTRRQEGPDAYSRILGATASPRGEALRGIFTNRWGRNLTVGAAIDLIDVVEQAGQNDRFDFRAQLAWLPGERIGVELDYQNQTVVRTGADTADLSRRELFLRARADLAEGVRAEVLAGRAELRDEQGDGENVRSVDELGLAIGAALGELELSGSVRAYDGEGVAWGRAQAGAAAAVGPALRLEAAGELATWSDFTTSEGRVGAEADVRLGLPLTLRADATTGTRGISRPVTGMPEAVSFDAVATELEGDLGPYRLRGRASWERTDAQHPFGAPFDMALAPGPGAEITAWEVGARGPVLPMSWLVPGLATISGEGFWRHQEPAGDVLPLYAPRDLLGGRLFFVDDFFDGNLEIRLGGSYLYRGPTVGAQPGLADPVELPAYSWFTGHFQFRIGTFRAFWKVLNPAGLTVQDVAGVDLPRQFNIFGIQWEFFN